MDSPGDGYDSNSMRTDPRANPGEGTSQGAGGSGKRRRGKRHRGKGKSVVGADSAGRG